MLNEQERTGMKGILEVKNLKKHFVTPKSFFNKEEKRVRAVDDITLSISKGETLGLVGESGCGKSTFGRAVLRLTEPTSGSVHYNGLDILKLNKNEMRNMRKKMQIIFQDPYASLNPRMTVLELIKAPLDAFNIGTEKAREEKVIDILELVGLDKQNLRKYPHEFSGGQRQRIVLARALILNPEFIVCDEPVSALDVSIQSQVLNLMQKLKQDLNLTFLFISHDLSVVKHISDRVAVMYLGKIVEIADKKSLYIDPLHPYTKALMSSIPIPDINAPERKIILTGEVPSPLNPPTGCRFHTRCSHCMEKCKTQEPILVNVSNKTMVACHLYE
ncbi:MAG: ABC transporter ATP-binding protein [Tepidanaerobacteraceae bacterium]